MMRGFVGLAVGLSLMSARTSANAAEGDDDLSGALFDEMIKLQEDLKFSEALEKANEIVDKYPDSPAAKIADNLRIGFQAVGREVGPVRLKKWVQGEDQWLAWAEEVKAKAAEGQRGYGATLVVFWEEWCPHCRKELPILADLYARVKDQGLRTMGFTMASKPSTEETVRAFLSDNSIEFPVAIEDGKMSKRFGVKGVPAAAIVKAGVIVWRGHPKTINEALVQKFLP
mmetsp:Transcript_27443/g.47372  ORF Transcript_27443/g.47372 Transcript_27443/m.47372 type:complete len:228 (-) Transcript_27443:102-785(-)